MNNVKTRCTRIGFFKKFKMMRYPSRGRNTFTSIESFYATIHAVLPGDWKIGR